jgi:hypothetical protein
MPPGEMRDRIEYSIRKKLPEIWEPVPDELSWSTLVCIIRVQRSWRQRHVASNKLTRQPSGSVQYDKVNRQVSPVMSFDRRLPSRKASQVINRSSPHPDVHRGSMSSMANDSLHADRSVGFPRSRDMDTWELFAHKAVTPSAPPLYRYSLHNTTLALRAAQAIATDVKEGKHTDTSVTGVRKGWSSLDSSLAASRVSSRMSFTAPRLVSSLSSTPAKRVTVSPPALSRRRTDVNGEKVEAIVGAVGDDNDVLGGGGGARGGAVRDNLSSSNSE